MDPKDQEPSPFDRRIEVVDAQLEELSEELEAWKCALREGKSPKPGDIKRTLTEVRQLVRLASELEMKIAERDIRESGLHRPGYAIDFDSARSQIRCRLDRLRRCCREGTIPRGADG
ncbi:hypothetical protein E0K89_017320 [Aquicoccus sp. SCR17]|nr:hypothetical protein [Carideicomes alvinocaridis]